MTYSPTNLCSTIGAVGLNFSVRDGKRWIPNAINRLNKGLMPCISYKVKVYSLRFLLWKPFVSCLRFIVCLLRKY